MNIRHLGLLALLASTLALSGCAPAWKLVRQDNNTLSVPSQGYATTLPPGWVQLSFGDKAVTVLSHDGEDLDYIRISREDNAKTFQAIKKTASPSELPADLATDFIAAVKASQALSNVEVLHNDPATLGGKDGFHVLFAFTTTEGVRYQSEVYAVCTDDGFFALMYKAPVLHYFDLYEKDFQSVVAGFKLIPKGGSHY